ncbi:hypothetical protein D7X94_01015 [Acutalibacter sp. 1XD8-33]|uniref:hypothetical protein n=1 Tax=Acutalibacter sp. 1XD8-33 TaxID=2320081 RepID=UPI000EA39E90|nr:hypothetical protein [Acutalibacter sp. 1XD8-33]RKJ42089.1 hypothetical protein D7X94_01015 [Acutalibacter sp. 1XD8-33]
MKHNSLALGAVVLAFGLSMAACGSGNGGSSSSQTLAEGSSPAVNGETSGSLISSEGTSSALVESQEELHMMTVEETVDFFYRLNPEDLGLSGTEMAEYQIYPSEKAVPVDNLPCMKIIVYSDASGSNQPEGTFLVARDGTAVYRLEENEVTRVEK